MSIEKLKTQIETERKKGGPRLSKLSEKIEEERAAPGYETPPQRKKRIQEKTEQSTSRSLNEAEGEKAAAVKKRIKQIERRAIEEGRQEKEEAGWDEAFAEAKKRLAEEPEEIEVEPEQIVEKKEIKKPRERKMDKNAAEYLKHALSDHPELLTPEIKKNFQLIEKQEKIVDQNKDSTKKSAQEKVKKAEETIGRAREAVEEYANLVAEQYESTKDRLIEASHELWGEQKPGKKKASGGLEQKLLGMAGDKAGLEKSGLFGGIKSFFSDRKLKKQLGDRWDEFEVMREDYREKLNFYNNLLAFHGKKYGRLEEALGAGTTFQMAHRGGGEKLPGVRGR